MSATAHDALGKTVCQSLKTRFVRQDDRALFVAPADDLKEQVGGVRVVGQVADLVDGQHVRTGVGAEATFECRVRCPGR